MHFSLKSSSETDVYYSPDDVLKLELDNGKGPYQCDLDSSSVILIFNFTILFPILILRVVGWLAYRKREYTDFTLAAIALDFIHYALYGPWTIYHLFWSYLGLNVHCRNVVSLSYVHY